MSKDGLGVWNKNLYTFGNDAEASNFGMKTGDTMSIEAMNSYGLGQSNTTQSPSMFEGLGGLQGIGTGLQGLGSLGSLALGLKNYGLAKDTFEFNKNMKEKEYAMAKDAYDRKIQRATSIGDQMRAGKVQ